VKPLLLTALLSALACPALAAPAIPSPAIPSPEAIDAEVVRQMQATGVKGMAVAVIENGGVAYVQAYGDRNAAGQPLTTGTVMYGASLTKAVFAYTVLQLVDEGVIALDTPISRYLAKPLPEYAGFADNYAPYETLAGDERWRKITPRMLLTHSGGFSNLYFMDQPDDRLVIRFEPGSRYAYSGDGLILLQFVLEKGLGLDVGAEIQRRVFDRFGMKNSSLIWRPDFAANLANGWDEAGKPVPHDERSRVRANGSMDTTIADFARFSAGVARGEGLTPASRAEYSRAILPITTATQFHTLQPELPVEKRRPDLASGLGVVVFDGPQGHGFFKGGHDDITGNIWVCLDARKTCVAFLGNDVRAEKAYPGLVKFILGETGMPWSWEYGWTPLK
jgi:CubicO group peptidase (beta-lactamase class C family)